MKIKTRSYTVFLGLSHVDRKYKCYYKLLFIFLLQKQNNNNEKLLNDQPYYKYDQKETGGKMFATDVAIEISIEKKIVLIHERKLNCL